MIATYFKNTGEVELSGSVNELNDLSKQLQLVSAEITLKPRIENSLSSGKYLEGIRVKHLINHLVKISVNDNFLLIEGSPEKLAVLSQNLETDENDLKDYHIHIEYFEGHFYLSPESIPLIVQYV